MTPLKNIASFPAASRERLEQKFGITHAEAFFEHAVRNGPSLQQALGVAEPQLQVLVKLVQVLLAPEFVRRCQRPAKRKPRGVITE